MPEAKKTSVTAPSIITFKYTESVSHCTPINIEAEAKIKNAPIYKIKLMELLEYQFPQILLMGCWRVEVGLG